MTEPAQRSIPLSGPMIVYVGMWLGTHNKITDMRYDPAFGWCVRDEAGNEYRQLHIPNGMVGSEERETPTEHRYVHPWPEVPETVDINWLPLNVRPENSTTVVSPESTTLVRWHEPTDAPEIIGLSEPLLKKILSLVRFMRGPDLDKPTVRAGKAFYESIPLTSEEWTELDALGLLDHDAWRL